MKTKYRFCEGKTMNYLVHSVGVMSVSLILWGLVHIIFLPIGLVISFLLLQAKTGTELDLEAKTFSTYKTFFGKEYRTTIDLSPFKSGRLIFTSQKNTYESRFQANTLRVKTYDLELHTANWDRKHLYEFQDYHAARQTIELLYEHLQIEVFDEWGEKAAAAIQNRRR